MNCPRCQVKMKDSSISEGGITCNALGCSQCHGFWTGKQQLDAIESKLDQRIIEFRRIPSHEQQMNPLACPQCSPAVTMDKVASARDKKVILDVCPSCNNVWLDGGELDAIKRESLLSLLAGFYRSA